MRFTTKTEYGLVCLIYMAKNAELKFDPITIKELVEAEQFSQTYTEKIMQSLRQSGIVNALHGNHGGYVLARTPQEITLKEIVEALEGGTFDIFCQPKIREEIICTHFPLCGIKPVWEKTKNVLDKLYQGDDAFDGCE
jgi:Rrf2 family protein